MFFIQCYHVNAHENDEFKHGSISCHGWERTDAGMRKCFLDAKKEKCATLIYNHGLFHVSDPYDCQPKEEKVEREEILWN